MRRLLLKLGAALLVLLVGAVAVLALALVLSPLDPISEEGAARIKEGMTEDEVQASLGGKTAAIVDGSFKHWSYTWFGEDGEIVVSFVDGHVSKSARFFPKEPTPLLDRLWHRLRRLIP